MMKIYKEILQKLNNDLEVLETEVEDVLVKAEKGMKLTRHSLKNIRSLVVDKAFKTSKDEITFFKVVKPQLYSKLIYYAKLFNIESKRPRGSNKSQIKYLNAQIEKLQLFFNDNLEFYNYYRRNATFLDELYFLRGKTNIRLNLDSFQCFTDEQFSTSHDCTVSTIIAYDILIAYLKTEIDKLERYNGNGMEMTPPIPEKQSKLFWTANKTDLIELIYAVHSSGAINSGTVEIKELAATCEYLFNIDLGNYYHTYVEIRSRKSNNTKFLDLLKESLIKRYEESDE